uniref:Uncharacterized protein n=1 Tax=Amphimedon queenslandica TaxID=400682 RepID=A0A1X7U3G7_AMPQE
LATKFRVHSLPEGAERLEKCVGDFLKLSLFESFSESENHYAILSFLLCLSQSPTSHTSFTIPQSDPPPLPPAQDGRPFDWGRYLMEDVSFEEYESSSDDSEFIPCSDEDLPLSSHELDGLVVAMNSSLGYHIALGPSVKVSNVQFEGNKRWFVDVQQKSLVNINNCSFLP